MHDKDEGHILGEDDDGHHGDTKEEHKISCKSVLIPSVLGRYR